MKEILTRVVGFIYYKLSGVRAHNLHSAFTDMEGSIAALSRIAKVYANIPKETTWEQEFGNTEDKDLKDLSEYFTEFGSDKSTRHNYHLIYGSILKNKRGESFNLLEVGLGTPSVSVSSYSASSKAFKTWAPDAQIYGVDIDETALQPDEYVVKKYYADQTKPESLKSFTEKVPCKFDLIIDDGLHTSWANFNTIEATLPLLKDDGVLVVEDILEKYISFWPILMSTLSPTYECKFVKMRYSMVCIIRKAT